MNPRNRLKLHIWEENSWRKQAEAEFSCGLLALICIHPAGYQCSLPGLGRLCRNHWAPASFVCCGSGPVWRIINVHPTTSSAIHPSWSWWPVWKDSRTGIPPPWMTKAALASKACARSEESAQLKTWPTLESASGPPQPLLPLSDLKSENQRIG